MKFAVLYKMKPNVDQATIAALLARRDSYALPAGLELIAEYWTGQTSPAVIAVYEAHDVAALTCNAVAWMDAFEVDILPVTTWQEGLEKLKAHLGVA